MNETAEKVSVTKKAIHFGTIIGVFVLIIPASINSFYLPLIFLLIGANLFNDLYSRCKSNTKLVVLSAMASAAPLVTYLIL